MQPLSIDEIDDLIEFDEESTLINKTKISKKLVRIGVIKIVDLSNSHNIILFMVSDSFFQVPLFFRPVQRKQVLCFCLGGGNTLHWVPKVGATTVVNLVKVAV